ncbi:MAG TPA: NAD(P)/FAD-dependent oxidoreductase, partial [Acidimicrobiales bacterium]|nr:NAD(P)/FAD-dependent oxidoreductase [Acidimicrobiales bacterium]
MTTRRTLLIVGASLAGAKAAEGARAAGYDGRILLVGDEASAPYERPPLSKAVLRGEADLESTRVHADDFYAEHDVEVVTDHAVALDATDRRIELAGRGTIGFDRAVLATGAAPRRLDVPGHDLPGVHLLRTAEDAVALGRAIRAGSRVAVIGAGWIGSEVAASARQMGADVVLVDPGPVPLRRVLGDEVGGMFRRLHADNGVTLRLGTRVRELRGSGAVGEVVLDDGRVEDADVVVVGIGVVPRTELAAAASGLHVDDGIVVDHHLETSVAGVYAAGDVANAWHPHLERHVRVEHWANALHQGFTAGGNASGRHDVYGRVPYFFSDQYDVGMEYVGQAEPGDVL